ncbi:hypothetical protein ACWGSK_13170 [Nocardiopsis sp. NPDC055551]
MYEHSDVKTGLRNWAEGSCADRAAVELLIEHDRWLNRADFVRCIDVIPEAELFDPDRPVAVPDWKRISAGLAGNEFPASSSEVAILRIVLSLADNTPVCLQTALMGLDSTNAAAVVDAVITTTGAGLDVLATRGPEARRRVID